MGTGKKIVIGMIVFFLLATGGLYGVGAYFFSNHFLPNSSVNGLDVSYKTVDSVQEHMADEIATYTLLINEIDAKQEKIVAEQIGIEYEENEDIAQLVKNQKRWTWFLSLNNEKKYVTEAMTTYDKKKLKEAVNNLDCFKDMQEPVDARIEETESGYEIVPEVEGNTLDAKKVLRQVRKAIENGQPAVDLVKKKCYIFPEVYRDDELLARQKEQLNRLATAKITYDFQDRNEVVDSEILRSWLVQDAEGNYQLDEAQLKEYVHQLAVKYDTYGSERDFRTAEGNMIKVKGGDYGWVIYEEKEVEALKANIEAGEEVIREPEYLYRGYNREENDIGDTYVEVDLTKQRMCFYLNGTLIVDTPVVTGTPTKKFATPPGVYALDNKKSPAVLKGEDYASPVTYWMPFNKDVGIHDASWRSEFGGEIYKKNGSHGCVNTPYDMAEKIYNNIEVGVPIIVYE